MAKKHLLYKKYNITNKISYYIRKNLDISQRQFAYELGLDPSYLNKVVTGKFEPSIISAMVIAKKLGEPFENVFQLVSEEEKQEDVLSKPTTEKTEFEYLTVQDIVETLNVDVDTVNKWIEDGELEAINLGPAGYRIYHGDLLKFLKARKVKPKENNEEATP